MKQVAKQSIQKTSDYSVSSSMVHVKSSKLNKENIYYHGISQGKQKNTYQTRKLEWTNLLAYLLRLFSPNENNGSCFTSIYIDRHHNFLEELINENSWIAGYPF